MHAYISIYKHIRMYEYKNSIPEVLRKNRLHCICFLTIQSGWVFSTMFFLLPGSEKYLYHWNVLCILFLFQIRSEISKMINTKTHSIQSCMYLMTLTHTHTHARTHRHTHTHMHTHAHTHTCISLSLSLSPSLPSPSLSLSLSPPSLPPPLSLYLSVIMTLLCGR